MQKVVPVDAYAAVRTHDGDILTDASKFADPDLAPVIVAKFKLETENEGHAKIAIYHDDLEQVEIQGDPVLYGKESWQWAVVFETIRAFAEKLDAGPKPNKLKARWSMDAEEDLRAVHNLNAEKALSDILAREMLEDIDREFLNTQKVIKDQFKEIPLKVHSITIGQLKSQVKR